MKEDVFQLDALALGRMIANGQVDVRELVQSHLDQARAEDPNNFVFVRLLEDYAVVAAEAAHQRHKAGVALSALDGVPIAFKDNFDVAGSPTEAGSRLLIGRTPRADAAAVRTLAQAGLINFAKTNMTELAYSGLGYNPWLGTPSNPFDTETARLPGGSSSGSAMAVARGLAPIAMGTDTSGSIRIPAAWNNLVGFKPTVMRLSIEGVVPLSLSFDSVGPLCKTVADAAAIFELLAGEAAIDLESARPANLRLVAVEGRSLQGLEAPVLAAYSEAIERISSAGATIVDSQLPSLTEVLPVPSPVGAEAYALWGGLVEDNPRLVFPRVAERILAGKGVSAAEYIGQKAALQGLARRFLDETAAYDGVLVPTVGMRAPPISSIENSVDTYRNTNHAVLSLPSIASRLGLTAITLPAGLWGDPPLPVGISILSRPWSERRLLQIARVVERALSA